MAEVTQEKKRVLLGDDKVYTWPNLVRNEFLVALFVTVVLILWALLIDAPLEEPANPTRTPNPSKAPWYFLGLQEMLVYFDPWNAGVVMPTLIIVGLMVIPFIDINPKGNGYYCFKDRKYEILTFFLGFHVLWVSMIIIGTFFRGPGWNLFWPWQRWDPHKVVALTNVDLPYLLGFRSYWWSAAFGAFLIIAYFAVAITAFYFWILRVKGKEFMDKWGMVRFNITAFLFVTMLALPVKMFLRLVFNIKYIMVTPWLNI
jgi:Cytochrome b(C-terminal)/b6/petD